MSLYDYAQAQRDFDVKYPKPTTSDATGGKATIVLTDQTGLVKTNDVINSPNHYARGRFEVWDIIEFFKLNYNLGNVCKYILRAGVKTKNPLEDYKKARAYLDREISILEGKIDVRPS